MLQNQTKLCNLDKPTDTSLTRNRSLSGKVFGHQFKKKKTEILSVTQASRKLVFWTFLNHNK